MINKLNSTNAFTSQIFLIENNQKNVLSDKKIDKQTLGRFIYNLEKNGNNDTVTIKLENNKPLIQVKKMRGNNAYIGSQYVESKFTVKNALAAYNKAKDDMKLSGVGKLSDYLI
ncbi:MAG: hypothetical protein ACLSWI_05490 [Candidatus Gastranaerophilaceae bacterium]